MTLPPLPLDRIGPPAAALLVALAGRVLTRSRPAWRMVTAAAALAAGWALLAGAPRAWWAPRLVVEHLPGVAVAAVLAAVVAIRFQGRGQAAAGLLLAGIGAWWLAGAPAARPEFWRAWFAIMGLGWLIRRAGLNAGPAALALSATLSLGLFAVGAAGAEQCASWVLLATVLAGLREKAAIPALTMAAVVVASELGAGRVMRGGVGMVELVCLAALGAGLLRERMGQGMQRRLGRVTEVAAPVVLAVLGTAAAWVGARAMRG